MRVPHVTAPLVGIAQDQSGRQQNINLNAPAIQGAHSSAPFGGAQARFNGQLAENLGELARVTARAGAIIQQEDDETWARDAYNKLTERMSLYLDGDGDPETGLLNRKGEAALGAVTDLRQFYERNTAELSRNLTPNAQKQFMFQAEQLKNSNQTRVAAHEASERLEWRFGVCKGMVGSSQQRAVDNFSDPRLREEALAEGMEALTSMHRMRGDAPEVIDESLRNYREAAYLAGIDKLIAQGDYAAARAALADPGLSGTSRITAGQRLAESGFYAAINEAADTGDIWSLNLGVNVAAGYTPEGFETFKLNLNRDYLLAARDAAQRHDVPLDLLLAVMQIESGGDAEARGGSGEIGLMQLMPGTADELGVDPYDYAQNIDGGAKYLARMLRANGEDWDKAIIGYNAGPGSLEKILRGEKALPEVTRRYLAGVRGLTGSRFGGQSGGDAPGGMPDNAGTPPASPAPSSPQEWANMSGIKRLQADYAAMSPEAQVRARGMLEEKLLQSAVDYAWNYAQDQGLDYTGMTDFVVTEVFPQLAGLPEVQSRLVSGLHGLWQNKEDLAARAAKANEEDVHLEALKLHAAGNFELSDYRALIHSLPPEDQEGMEEFVNRLIADKDVVPTDPAAPLEIVMRLADGQGFVGIISEYNDRLSLVDLETLKNPEKVAELKRHLSTVLGKGKQLGLDEDELEKVFAALVRAMSERTFKTDAEVEEFVGRMLVPVVFSKPQRVIGGLGGALGPMSPAEIIGRGYDALDKAQDGYYPTAGYEEYLFRTMLEQKGADYARMTVAERNAAYKALLQASGQELKEIRKYNSIEGR